MTTDNFRENIVKEIETTTICYKGIRINSHFVNNPFLEILGDIEDDYTVKFFDNDKLIHYTTIKNNMWTKVNRKYFTNWIVKVYNSKGDLIYEDFLNLENKKVYIKLCSKSLGDTLAWLPYVEEFRKKHNCDVIVSTFINYLFIEQYPEITFVKPGDVVDNIYASYDIGWFYNTDSDIDYNRCPSDFRSQPLQKTASDILGIDYTEIKPKLNLINNVIKDKKVGIAIHGTSQSKYWNNEKGWQEVVDYLNDSGYKVVLYSLEKDGYMGNKHPNGIEQFPTSTLNDVINDIQTCEFFIGIGSGLSWLAWSIGLPVILISGFSDIYTEPSNNVYRVINKDVCNSCFNSYRLDASDWNWCPINKGRDKQFECTKSITSDMVINKINQLNKKTMNWKLYHDKINQFEYKNFENNKNLAFFNGYDFIYKEIYNFEYSDKGCIYEMWNCYLKPNDVVLDLGANVGFFTRKAAQLASRVIAVDGSPEVYSCLVENCADLNNVQTLNCSILNENSEMSWLWSYKKNNPLRMTLEQLMDLYQLEKIDFLKCDIEGGEYELFQKLPIEILSKIDRIAIETHDELKNENFQLPGKTRHSYYWNFGGGVQTMFYFV